MPEDQPTPDQPARAFRRPYAKKKRTTLLIAVGVVLAFIVLTGRCRGTDITEEQAIATATNALAADPGAFEPAKVEAKVLRQGFPPSPMWIVVFTVPDPEGGPEDVLRHAAVWVDAGTGKVRQIDVTETGEG